VKANALPDKFTAFEDESYVPLNDVAVPPARCAVPVAEETAASTTGANAAQACPIAGKRPPGRSEAVTTAWMMTVSVPVCPLLPANVP